MILSQEDATSLQGDTVGQRLANCFPTQRSLTNEIMKKWLCGRYAARDDFSGQFFHIFEIIIFHLLLLFVT